MDLQNSFVVPAPVDDAWAKLLELEAVAPCLPGASLTGREGDTFSGTVKVKLGPVTMTYGGTGKFVELDPASHRAVIEAAGKDSRGSSTAKALIHTQLVEEEPGRTRVDVTTDLAITGRPAQFGRGVMQDVAGRIIDQFAANLSDLMAAPAPGETPAPEVGAAGGELPSAPPAQAGEAGPAAAPQPRREEAIDLLQAAGTPVLKRLLPVLAGAVVLLIVWRVLRRAR
ncbi:MAG TPA: SRPBCC family protein [Actinomycetes bacterium]|nr:SRPBCC family protein [Actinomycetes bacterium]